MAQIRPLLVHFLYFLFNGHLDPDGSGRVRRQDCIQKPHLPPMPISALKQIIDLTGNGKAHFLYFEQQFYSIIVDFSGIRTQIVGVEGEHSDHLTTTTTARTIGSL